MCMISELIVGKLVYNHWCFLLETYSVVVVQVVIDPSKRKVSYYFGL
jgi:hypothetical protein